MSYSRLSYLRTSLNRNCITISLRAYFLRKKYTDFHISRWPFASFRSSVAVVNRDEPRFFAFHFVFSKRRKCYKVGRTGQGLSLSNYANGRFSFTAEKMLSRSWSFISRSPFFLFQSRLQRVRTLFLRLHTSTTFINRTAQLYLMTTERRNQLPVLLY